MLSHLVHTLKERPYLNRVNSISNTVCAKVSQQVFGRLIYIKFSIDSDNYLLVGTLKYNYDNKNSKLISFIEISEDFVIPIEVQYTKNPSFTLKETRKRYRESLPEHDDIEISFYLNELSK